MAFVDSFLSPLPVNFFFKKNAGWVGTLGPTLGRPHQAWYAGGRGRDPTRAPGRPGHPGPDPGGDLGSDLGLRLTQCTRHTEPGLLGWGDGRSVGPGGT